MAFLPILPAGDSCVARLVAGVEVGRFGLELGGAGVHDLKSRDNSGGFGQAWPIHSETRLVAGEPATNDIMKCALKPASMDDYKVRFTAAQQSRLKKAFSAGTCDYSKPGEGMVPFAGPYQKY